LEFELAPLGLHSIVEYGRKSLGPHQRGPDFILADPLCCPPARNRRMQFDQLKRREVITLLGAAAAWPLAAHAQQQAGKAPRIGFLSLTSPSDRPPLLDAFRQRLRELGWVEARILSSTIDMRRVGSACCPT